MTLSILAVSSSHGGFGGTTAYDLRCPRGWAVTGLQGRSGALVDRIQLICAPVQLDGTAVRRCTIGLLGLGSAPERAPAAEAAVAGVAVDDLDPEEIGTLAMSSLESVPSDLHGSAQYRRRVGAAMVAVSLSRIFSGALSRSVTEAALLLMISKKS